LGCELVWEKEETFPINRSAKALPVLTDELLVSKVSTPFVAVPGCAIRHAVLYVTRFRDVLRLGDAR